MTEQLLNYIPTPPVMPEAAGARKYHGEVAANYDAKREQTPKWIAEQRIIEQMLSDLPPGSWILDAPCGTGRFFEFYQRQGFIVRGVDLEADMLNVASQKISNPTAIINGNAQFVLVQNDVRRTGLPDKSIDATVNVRITRWIENEKGEPCPIACQNMFREMQRISRDRVVLTTRIAHPTHPDIARPVSLFESALKPGWKLAFSEAGSEEDYRVLMFRRSV